MAVTIDLLIKKHEPQLAEFEKKLGYDFKDRNLLMKSLIHRSFAAEQGKALNADNETLEFLGDAVLDLTVGVALFKRYPGMREGELTKMRAALVNESHLAFMARILDVGSFLFLGKGEDASKGRQKPSIMSCAFEAVLGAIFLDGGYEEAADFVGRHFSPWFEERLGELVFSDNKSRLQELVQEILSQTPVYALEGEEGPDHEKMFTVSVRLGDRILAQGKARNKKEAEQQAALAALENIDFSEMNRSE